MTERWCINCIFSFVELDHAHTQCRFHAPVVGCGNPESSGWPRVNDDDWCGQFVLDPAMAEDEE